MNVVRISCGLLIAIAIGITISVISRSAAVPPCPHPNFIDNHLCTSCSTLDDAANFSKYRPRPSGRNTVFFGRPRFEVKSYMKDRCGNIDAVMVAVCTASGLDPTEYICHWLGSRCIGEHSITNGHLFYRDIKC